MKKTSMLIIVILLSLVSIAGNLYFALNQTRNEPEKVEIENFSEQYVYIVTNASGDEYTKDIEGLNAFSDVYGVETVALAPESFDVVSQIKLITESIEKRPRGLIIAGSDVSLNQYINMAVDAGIPTVVIDSDLPYSKRQAYVGIDWYQFGQKQAKDLAEMIGDEGIVAMIGIVGTDSVERAFEGFMDEMNQHEAIVVCGGFDDMGNEEEAERVTRKLTKEYDLAGIAGFSINSGLGVANALKDLDLRDDIMVTSLGATESHIKALKTGYLDKLYGEKRPLLTYYAGRLLYDLNHGKLSITNDDGYNDITNVPVNLYIGYYEVDITNVDNFDETKGK